MNIKLMLIEKERKAYINNDPEAAFFFDAVLQHIIALEEQVNKKDAYIEELMWEESVVHENPRKESKG